MQGEDKNNEGDNLYTRGFDVGCKCFIYIINTFFFYYLFYFALK